MGDETPLNASWIDIPVQADDVVGSALLAQFLKENDFPFEQSARFFSVPAHEADRLAQRTEVWAFRPEMPPDERVADSLDAALRRLGEVVMLAIAAARANIAPNSSPAAGIDLTRSPRDRRAT